MADKSSPILGQNLKKRIDQSNNSSKKIKRHREVEDYTPSVFENKKKFTKVKMIPKASVSFDQRSPEKEDSQHSRFYRKMRQS